MILDCLHRGKYPSYDAANLESVALAQKLGYVLDEPYDTYYIHSKEN
ncbi:GNAT family N-acetyltransferase [Clostridium tagluense]|nr:GNAT family N-acetyltransferase [Clostridium tagluense]